MMIMRLSSSFVLLLLLAVVTCSVEQAYGYYSPVRISYNDLITSKAAPSKLKNALTSVGMVSITNIPNFNKQQMLQALPSCIESSTETAAAVNNNNNEVLKITYPDGTTRKTLATHAGAEEGADFQHKSSGCHNFDQETPAFRKTVSDVTAKIFQQLDDDKKLLLSNPNGHNKDYTLSDIVKYGDHLEHFHLYESAADADERAKNTIDWHTDQGMALVFTPGQSSKIGIPTNGFYIQLGPDGGEKQQDVVEVKFTTEDDLVVLLGDGVNQYVNNRSDNSEPPLRSVKHSFRMPATSSTDEARVWYGRMVLPPSDGVHPLYEDSTTTFGSLRETMISHKVNAIGCSSSSLVARELQDMTCDTDTQFYCWHTCFNLTEDLSEETCASQGSTLECINNNGDLWNETIHDEAYKPRCLAAPTTSENGDGNTTATNHTMDHNKTTGTNGHDDHDGHDHSDHNGDTDHDTTEPAGATSGSSLIVFTTANFQIMLAGVLAAVAVSCNSLGLF